MPPLDSVIASGANSQPRGGPPHLVAPWMVLCLGRLELLRFHAREITAFLQPLNASPHKTRALRKPSKRGIGGRNARKGDHSTGTRRRSRGQGCEYASRRIRARRDSSCQKREARCAEPEAGHCHRPFQGSKGGSKDPTERGFGAQESGKRERNRTCEIAHSFARNFSRIASRRTVWSVSTSALAPSSQRGSSPHEPQPKCCSSQSSANTADARHGKIAPSPKISNHGRGSPGHDEFRVRGEPAYKKQCSLHRRPDTRLQGEDRYLGMALPPLARSFPPSDLPSSKNVRVVRSPLSNCRIEQYVLSTRSRRVAR